MATTHILSYICNLIAGRNIITNLYHGVEKARDTRNNARAFNFKFSLREIGIKVYNGEELINLDNLAVKSNIYQIVNQIDPRAPTLDSFIILLLQAQNTLLNLYNSI